MTRPMVMMVIVVIIIIMVTALLVITAVAMTRLLIAISRNCCTRRAANTSTDNGTLATTDLRTYRAAEPTTDGTANGGVSSQITRHDQPGRQRQHQRQQ